MSQDLTHTPKGGSSLGNSHYLWVGAVQIRGGHKFQCKQIEGGRISVCGRRGGQISSAPDFRICIDPPPVNNDRSLTTTLFPTTTLFWSCLSFGEECATFNFWPTNMKNDDIRPLAFWQYILFMHYSQPVLIYLGKSNNVDKTDEDPTWWP